MILVCVECDAEPETDARGWRAFLTAVDDEDAIYCGECARKEFSDD
jgi:hypothetical protein